MRAALRDSYVEFVIFTGVTERYPLWFQEEIYDSVMIDESRYTFWLHKNERSPDYYEKQLIEDYSVIVRKPNGELHLTDYDIFTDLYITFKYDGFINSGIAAFEQDCIEYIECTPGILTAGYPNWFYEFFTEAFNFPQDNETIFIFDESDKSLKASRGSISAIAGGEVIVKEHCVFLRNKFNEIKSMTYNEFLKYYDPDPELGV